ncbi:MAG: hypothetical protein ACRDK9_03275 [Solirubrobacterales bacterium]
MAEPASQGGGAEAEAPGAETEAEAPGAEQIRGWGGYRLDGIGGSIGKVEGAFVDEASGAPVWLLARMGRFGHHTLVPARDAVEGVGRVWVPYGRDQIREAPKVDPSTPLTAAAERALLDHYGIEHGAGRAGELAARGEGVTSRRA